MSDELRAAEERMRRRAGDPPPYSYPNGDFKEILFENDTNLIVDAYLAEHPADDGDSVTEEWLRAAGFQDRGDLVGWTRLLLPAAAGAAIAELRLLRDEDGWTATLAQGMPYEPDVIDDILALTSLPPGLTRGHVRRLVRALGVPLTEPV